MVTQNINFIDSHLALPSEPPPIVENMSPLHPQLHSQTQIHSQTQLHVIPEKKHVGREDPMSHRIIEKRRRDRMNNCLADLSRLIPADYLKKGRGRIEKTEIIEMAIKYMKHLRNVVCSRTNNPSATETPMDTSGAQNQPHHLENFDQSEAKSTCSSNNNKQDGSVEYNKITPDDASDGPKPHLDGMTSPINLEHFKLGYQECVSESMHYLVEVKGYYPGSSLCMQMICHLQKHCDKILRGDRLNKPRTGDSSTSTSSPGSQKPHGPGSGSSSSDSCERVLPKSEPNDVYDTSHSGGTQHREGYEQNSFSHNREHFERNIRPNHQDHREGFEAHMGEVQNEFYRNREYLTTPNLSLFNFEQESGLANGHHNMNQVPRHHLEHYPASPTYSNETNSLYKFKNNIKQRFTAEHSVVTPNDNSSGYLSTAPPLKKSKPNETYGKYGSDSSNDQGNHCEARSGEISTHSSRYYYEASSKTREVAIFALHMDGSFYVPLTVDYNVLVPFLNNTSLTRSCRRSNPMVLHPVTISVSFQQWTGSRGGNISQSNSSSIPTEHNNQDYQHNAKRVELMKKI